jgi:thioredoxin reductase
MLVAVPQPSLNNYEAAIVGGGPAGLSAALLLGRSCRRVILFDHGQPRNYAGQAVHGFLALDGIKPNELRHRAREQAAAYGVEIVDRQVISARCLPQASGHAPKFELSTDSRVVSARALLLATGVSDHLPDIPGVRELYGRSVHHCPYCDGWEHRHQRLVALGKSDTAAQLALTLRGWSDRVTACSHGNPFSASDRSLLARNDITCCEEKIRCLREQESSEVEIVFEAGLPLTCDAIFFSADQGQRSPLAEMLGCKANGEGIIETDDEQATEIEGLFVAGDAGGDIQFAVLAAAEGACAAVAINKMFIQQESR